MTQPPALPDADEIAAIFADDVRPTLTAPSQESPRLLVLGGPQGSRKTSLRTEVPDQLGITDPVLIDGDDFYAFLPGFDGLARSAGALAAMQHFSPVVKELVRMTHEHVRENRQNVVLVGPYTNAEYTAGVLAKFPDHRRELAYTAMHPAISQLAVMHRYHQAAQTQGAGVAILPSVELQESVYVNSRIMLDKAQAWETVSALHVVDSLAGGVVFTQERGNGGEWAARSDIRVALDQARNQPWSTETRATFERWRAGVASVGGDQWSERLARVDELAAPMLALPHGQQAGAAAPVGWSPGVAAAARLRSTTSGGSSPGDTPPQQHPAKPEQDQRPRHQPPGPDSGRSR